MTSKAKGFMDTLNRIAQPMCKYRSQSIDVQYPQNIVFSWSEGKLEIRSGRSSCVVSGMGKIMVFSNY